MGQAAVPQGGVENEAGETRALKPESCFSSFFDPQFGQAGWRDPDTSCSEISPQALQMYSKSGMNWRIYFTAPRASINTLAWRMPTNSLTFFPSLKMTR